MSAEASESFHMWERTFPLTESLTHLEKATYEKIVTKGEIAYDEQFLFLSDCF